MRAREGRRTNSISRSSQTRARPRRARRDKKEERNGSSEPGIIKPVNSWNQWIINFQWNMVEKFTAWKVHWFGILDPAHYLPVPVVQSVTLPNSPTFNETYIFEITIKNGVDSWVLGLSNQRKIFGPIYDFFTFSATIHHSNWWLFSGKTMNKYNYAGYKCKIGHKIDFRGQFWPMMSENPKEMR